MQSDNGKSGNSSSQILPLVIAAFAGATLAIACERPASRVAAGGDAQTAAHASHAQTAARTAPESAQHAAAPAAPPRESLSDPIITSRIKSAIVEDPGMTGSDVSVSTDHGAVTLVGPVRNHEQIALASAHAQRQDGVTRVDNHLSVPAQ